MALLLPEVGASGAWVLGTPFHNILSTGVWYTCIAVRKFEDFVKIGIDPYEEFYNQPNGIVRTRYEQDIREGHCIITVKSLAGDVKSFPSSYVESYPLGGGVAYQALALAIDLGALPTSLNLDDLKLAVSNIVRDIVGVEGTARLVNLAPRELLDRASHERVEAARKLLIKGAYTDSVKVKKLTDENAKLKRDLDDANAWIIANKK